MNLLAGLPAHLQEDNVRIAVTGAGGRLGGQVVRLLAAQEYEVVALSRQEIPVERRLAHVSQAMADYEDLGALHAALRGVDTLVFISSDGETARVILHHQNVIRAAADSGVAHVVALSGLDADLSSPFCYAVTYGHTERLLRDSGCAVSIARASIFTEFFLGFLIPARISGEIRLPADDGRISLVSRADVARCLAALVVTTPTGRSHDITGPEALDLASIAALAESEWGVPIRYVGLTPAGYRVEMARAGEEPWWQYAYSTMFDSVRQQRWSAVSGEVLRLTGRSPASARDVFSYCSKA
jgi:NAD(P)H dehydrogenase (quinone)